MAERLAARFALALPKARRSPRNLLIGYALILPAFALVAGLMLYPLLYDLWLSLTDSVSFQGPGRFVGLRNYIQLAGQPTFWEAARNTAFLVTVTASAELAVGILTALLLWWRFPGRPIVFLTVFVPWAFPAAFSAFAWYWLLTPPFHSFYTLHVLAARGWLDHIFGIGAWQVLSIGVMNVWRGSSIIAVFLLAGFNAIPEELLDYGKLEARNRWLYFWHVVLPQARRFLILGGLVAVVITYVEYVSMYVETGGRITVPVLGTLAYQEAFQLGHTGLGAALALVQLPLALLRVAASLRFIEREPRPRVPEVASLPPIGELHTQPGPLPGVRLAGAGRRRLRRPLLIAAGLGAVAAVVAFHLFPVYYTGVQAFRSIPEYAIGNPFWVYNPDFDEMLTVLRNPKIWRWALNTFVIFAIVLLAGLSTSLLAGYGLARFRLPGGRWLARLMFFSYFIPQMAVIVPVFQLFLLWHLDDTIPGIALLYLTLVIPFATWLSYAYFLGMETEVEDHARLEGSRLQVFLRIVMPMSWPIVIAAGLFSIGMMGSDVLYAGVFSFSNATQTLPAGLGLIAIEVDEWAPANAAILLSSLPLIIACAALGRYYVHGLRAALVEGA